MRYSKINRNRPWAAARLLIAAGVVALITTLLSVTAALAAGVTVRLTPLIGPPTTPFTVAGTGFGVSESVAITFDGTVIATATTGSDGGFTAAATVPASAVPGGHTVIATG